MCGLSGAIGRDNRALVERMNERLVHRGPDAGGLYSDQRFSLGARRLRIVDLSNAGDQPLAAGPCRLVYNGEIYNREELRRRYRPAMHPTVSDTELLLSLLAEKGIECLSELRGMYAFAFWDGRQLYLVRDPIGIKPLYYSMSPDQRRFAFASEAKAVLECPWASIDVDEEFLVDRLLLPSGYSPCPARTLFRSVLALPPGHVAVIDPAREPIEVRLQPFVAEEPLPYPGTLAEAVEELRRRFEESVRLHAQADAPVCVALSGGLDSTYIAAEMARAGSFHAFHLEGDANGGETEIARIVGRSLNLEFHAVRTGFREFLKAMPTAIFASEDYVTWPGTYLLFRAAAQAHKVCLVGEGSDELFLGYGMYLDRAAVGRAVAHNEARVARLGLRPSPRAESVISALRSEDWRSRLESEARGQLLVEGHLMHMDKLGMASSLEVRVPFLDREVWSLATSLPFEFKASQALAIRKRVLRHAFLEAHGLELLDVVLRGKSGFPSAERVNKARYARLCDRFIGDERFERAELGRLFPSKADWVNFELLLATMKSADPTSIDVVDFVEALGRTSARVGRTARAVG